MDKLLAAMDDEAEVDDQLVEDEKPAETEKKERRQVYSF